MNVRTPGILKAHGFLYDSSLMGDDVPYLLETSHGPLIEVPVQWILDDAPLFRHVYGATNAIAVSQIAFQELDIGIEIIWPLGIPVHLGIKGIEHPYPIAGRQQFTGKMRPNEPGAACDKNCRLHDAPPRAERTSI